MMNDLTINKKLFRRLKCARTMLKNVFELSENKNELIQYIGMTGDGLEKVIKTFNKIEGGEVDKNQLDLFDELKIYNVKQRG